MITNIGSLSQQITSIQVNFNQILSQYGLIDVVLPFLLIFSLVFMLLELSNLLKTSPDDAVGRKLSALFAFGFSLLSLYNQNLIKWLVSFIPNATIVIIVFFLLAITLALTNKKVPGVLRAFFAFLIVGILLWLSINSLSITGSSTKSPLTYYLLAEINSLMQSGILSSLLIVVTIFLILILVMMWAVSGGEKKEEEEGEIKGPLLVRSK
jgi:predicted neutral ceramidase superfamily lipid hydrolase